ncbi:MAG: aldo/keto reductase [Eggerthellaceae bacterium]|nr:aldo/keto reductase [Eggerthellaceae bacterium]
MPKIVEIGNSGVLASNITMGAMGIGGGFRYPDSDDAESIRAIHAAIDAGITLIDSAPVYGFGHSEEVIGKAIADRRDKVVVSTKCGLWWDDEEGSYRFTWEGKRVKRNLSARTLRIELQNSLKRLGTDYIDIYYTHNPACPPFDTPIEETIGVLEEFKREGYIRAIGASNAEVHHVQSYLDLGSVDIVQRRYSMFDHSAEETLFAFARKKGLSLHGYSVLEKGLFGGSVKRGHDLAHDEARNNSGSNAPGNIWASAQSLDLAVDYADALAREVAAPLGLTLAELAIAYDVNKGVNPIVGIRRESHVAGVVRGSEVELPSDILSEIDRRADELTSKVNELGA